ncbi:hypothetical protein BC833DRAFT_580678 [Globomyces pollinis-pini]|nr:hypothetical protein BC833DRAFT_580678 [Globomyces pollinis-pini]
MLLVSITEFVFSIIGTIGSVWVLAQFLKGKQILRNFPGLLIFGIAWTDLLTTIPYFVDSLCYFTGTTEQFLQFNYRIWFLFPWSTISCCCLGIALAFNTFMVVRFLATIQGVGIGKWFLLVLIFLLPILIYFLPLSLIYGVPLFSIAIDPEYCRIQSTFICAISSHLLFYYVIIALCICLGAYLSIYFSFKIHRNYHDAASKSQYALRNLIMIYCLFQMIVWVPYIVSRIGFYWGPKDLLSFFSFVDCIFVPARGYIHALGVVCANRAISNHDKPFRTIFCLELCGSFKDKQDSIKSESTIRPSWDFTFDGVDFQEPSTSMLVPEKA